MTVITSKDHFQRLSSFGLFPSLAWYMYQYVRILQYSRPQERSRPFFWIFLDNLVLEEETRDAACRFLKVNGNASSFQEFY